MTFLPEHFKGISRTRIWFHFCHSFSIFGLFVIHDIYILSSVGFAFEKYRARKSSYHLQFKFFQLNLRASYANYHGEIWFSSTINKTDLFFTVFGTLKKKTILRFSLSIYNSGSRNEGRQFSCFICALHLNFSRSLTLFNHIMQIRLIWFPCRSKHQPLCDLRDFACLQLFKRNRTREKIYTSKDRFISLEWLILDFYKCIIFHKVTTSAEVLQHGGGNQNYCFRSCAIFDNSVPYLWAITVYWPC